MERQIPQPNPPGTHTHENGLTDAPLQAYAVRTGTRRTLEALRKTSWRLLITSGTELRTEGFPYALDNGAWHAYQHGIPWDAHAFTDALKRRGSNADWTVLPDIVTGGHASLTLSLQWMRRVLDACPYALLAVQDGLTSDDVVPFLGERVGIFVGGSTAWKEATMPQWGTLGRRIGCIVHVGRVNSVRRIRLCAMAGVTSFDGTSVTRYAKTLPLLEHARQQCSFVFEEDALCPTPTP